MLYIYLAVTPGFSQMAHSLIASVYKHSVISDVAFVYDTFDESDAEQINTLKMFRIYELALRVNPGDKILKLDVDMIVNVHPCRMFDNVTADVIVASRHYKCRFPLNAGTVGYVVNERSRAFLRFFCRQLGEKTWQPYREFQRRFGRGDKQHFLDEQDLLCTAWENQGSLPLGVKMHDAGPYWNWTVEKNAYELLGLIDNPDYGIIHFKGDQKTFLTKGASHE